MADRRSIEVWAQLDAPMCQIVRSAAPVAVALADGARCRLDPDIMKKLHDAALSAQSAACAVAIREAVSAGTCPEDIADFYIPELARRMGDAWSRDALGFASVTIGVSRLQAMLRDLGPSWAGDSSADAGAPSIMLVVPHDVHHTLGAMVLAGQLRRKGFSVRVVLGANPEDVTCRMQRTKFHAVFISAAPCETWEALRRLVGVVKTATDQSPPVVIGGSLLAVETDQSIIAFTGADYATTQSAEAIRLCGLGTHSRDDATMMRRA
ncbi:B12-binding domain-containing protein [Yoonia sp.]|uniref:cobalamin B12-binding domain-containing protein n=1 Tax=Yoonia sp. TaxID=2212373 RepID=UPI0025D56E44|nr:cobalamin B12-binding domain-containing protein [Yoonia sp.]